MFASTPELVSVELNDLYERLQWFAESTTSTLRASLRIAGNKRHLDIMQCSCLYAVSNAASDTSLKLSISSIALLRTSMHT